MIPITRPIIGDEEIEAVADVLRGGALVQGAHVAEFERTVADLVGTEYAVAMTNCTAALRAALLAIGVGRGDLVAVAPYSWVTTANVIELCGARPLFVDIDPVTFNMSATELDRAIDRLGESEHGGRLKAILPVHTFGNPAGILDIARIASGHGVPMIEDAACAIGAFIDGRAAGSIGDMGCFSFHPRKVVTTGEGGMVTTDSEALAVALRAMRNHGQVATLSGIEFAMPGDNLRMTDFQAAMGVVQMGRLEGLIAQRSAVASRYDVLLAGRGCTPQRRASHAVVQSYVTLLPEGGPLAADAIAYLRSHNVEATIGTNGIPFVRYYQDTYGLTEVDLPVTANVMARAVTLPLFPGMTDEQQDQVVETLEAALG